MKYIKLLLISLLLLSLTSCNQDLIKKQIKEMSLDEKIGMLFIIRPDALDLKYSAEDLADNSIIGSTKISEEMKDVYNKYPAGGFAIFKKNILSEEQLISFTNQLHSLSNYYPLVCIDEEGGLVARIANHDAFNVKKFTSMQEIAESNDSNNAYILGNTIGEYLNKYGIDVDFAPVADVNTNPDNPVIGERAFGDNPIVAGEMVSKVIDGLHNNGIKSCIKHFPGHGDTSTDTHLGYAQTSKTWDEMLNCEMIPFKKGIEANTDLIMIAHITATNVEDNVPATLSHILLSDKLRKELGYEGVIITDSMAMGAITKEYSSAQACIKAIQAGVDIVLMPENYIEAFEGLKEAVKNNEISISRIEESVYRILKLKNK